MFTLTSPAFNNHRIDTRYGNLGPEENIKFGIPQTSFPLTWKGAPEGTVSYAIVFIDYDDVPDEGVPFIHWLACNIPGNQNSLPENSSRLTPDYLQGYNSWCMPFPGYKEIPKDYCRHFGGPAPGYQHEYEVWIYALDTVLDLEEGFWYNQLRRKMKGHILASASLCGYYGT